MKKSQLRSHNLSQPTNENTLDKYDIKKLRNKDNFCKCSDCSILTIELVNSYYKNPALIRDSDRLVHISRVEK